MIHVAGPGEETGDHLVRAPTSRSDSSPAARPPRTLLSYLVVFGIVGLAVIFGLVWIVGHPYWVSAPGKAPIGTAFAADQPAGVTCSAGASFPSDGCQAGHFAYTIDIGSSTVNFGGVAFEVTTHSGSVYNATGGLGFTVLSRQGVVVAQFMTNGGGMAMNSSWIYGPGTSESTGVATTDTIVIDMGTANPHGLNLEFVAIGLGPYSGATQPLKLP